MSGLQERCIIGDREEIDGTYTVVCQVTKLVQADEHVPTIRLIRDVPPTPIEVSTINEAMSHFMEPAKAMGMEIEESDINIGAPAVLMRAIAIFRSEGSLAPFQSAQVWRDRRWHSALVRTSCAPVDSRIGRFRAVLSG